MFCPFVKSSILGISPSVVQEILCVCMCVCVTACITCLCEHMKRHMHEKVQTREQRFDMFCLLECVAQSLLTGGLERGYGVRLGSEKLVIVVGLRAY